MKHFITLEPMFDRNDIVEHESEEAARLWCRERVEETGERAASSHVAVYRLVTRAKAKVSTEFDGGCDDRG